jgi:hypothetical protein
MTLLAGELRRVPQATSSPYITTDFDQFDALGLYDPNDADVGSLLFDFRVDNYPVSMAPRALAGEHRSSYFLDFYFRIHVTPNPIALGNILSNKSVPISIWNAYLEPKTINDISVPSETGTTMVPPFGVSIPYVLAPTREITFQLVVSTSGVPTIDSAITFDVGTDLIVAPLTGRRLVVFPFPPNWKTSYDESFVFNSWVLPAADGSEQTGSNWGNQPRHEFEYTVLLTDTQRQLAENMLFGWQHQFFGVPHWAERGRLSSTALAGATVLALDTTGLSFAIDGYGLLFKDADTYEAFQITGMDASSITISSPTQAQWPDGTRVHPVSVGLLGDSVGGSYYTDNAVVMPIKFQCEPSLSPVNTITGAPPLTYRGEELYFGRLNWMAPLSFSFNSDRNVLDFQTGRVKSYSTAGFSAQTRKHNWQIKSVAEAIAYRAWLGRRQGVARPVYMPTGNSDFTLVNDVLDTSETIEVADNGYAGFVAEKTARRDIIILLRDGSYIARRITASAVISVGVLRLTLDAAVGADLSPSSIKRISYLTLYRLTSNNNTIRWLTDRVGTAEENLLAKTTN